MYIAANVSTSHNKLDIFECIFILKLKMSVSLENLQDKPDTFHFENDRLFTQDVHPRLPHPREWEAHCSQLPDIGW